MLDFSEIYFHSNWIRTSCCWIKVVKMQVNFAYFSFPVTLMEFEKMNRSVEHI